MKGKMGRNPLDLVGQRFGVLIAIEGIRLKSGALGWRCRCTCDDQTVVEVPTGWLRSGNTTSCGCGRNGPRPGRRKEKTLRPKVKVGRPVIDLTGKQFGKLSVLRRAPSQSPSAWWTVICECAPEREYPVSGAHLRSTASNPKGTQSCGCIENSPNLRHGHARAKPSATYQSWKSMIERCYNPKASNYKYYGGCGVGVCDRWRYSFEAFVEDKGLRPMGKTLDRWPDADGNYTPENTRWATAKEQTANRRQDSWVVRRRKLFRENVIAAIPEYAVERQLCFAAIPKKRGRRPAKYEEAVARVQLGASVTEVAAELAVPVKAVYRWCYATGMPTVL
jgi:hypothetical protein